MSDRRAPHEMDYLYDIRALMAMMLVGSFAEPAAISAIADPRIREVMEIARADLEAVGKASKSQFLARLHGRSNGA
jgi:hypothetical protein